MTDTICICEVIKRTPWPSTTFTATIKVNPLCPLHGSGRVPAASEGEAENPNAPYSSPENIAEAAKLESHNSSHNATPVPQPASEDDEIRKLFTDYFLAGDERVEGHLIPDIQALFAQARAEGRREELESLKNHREFIYWGDGTSSDLDKYIEARLAQLNGERS